ncbi:hypothetical protein QBC34DRAFT_149242 [Podospora aff. communis PSN243]|uniref:NFX1-type zinc finger-containing protein 1 n=1 Tax=Podospora aff. communis PSN243 TaxID=3040156 RepID=A0AAV9GCJ7_9PEZI|nr:hypothetical protein QBC34DRAFT_149242 [Podospora aff. communis PSN243]
MMYGNRPRGGRPPRRQLCRQFQEHGTCRFGPNCKFSHDTGPRQDAPATRQRGGHHSPLARPTTNTARNNTNNPSQRGGDGKLREWKRFLAQASQTPRPPPAVASRFFQLGLELMDGDIGAAQETVKLFASEAGLSFVKDAADRHLAGPTAVPDGQLWSTEFQLLFQIITHPFVTDSAVLEQEVASVYNFLYGVGGERMSRVFSFVTRLLSSWPATSSTELSRIASVELALAVLSRLLDCNTSNIINDRFEVFVASLSKSLEDSSRSEDQFSRLQASKYIDYIRLRLGVGDQIASVQGRPQGEVTREHFRLRRDLPGQLSADGPRHDNDHADITKIKILPTREEITSPRAEYLPTIDPSEWHIKGIRGRLDREFRLLREDTVGQLRDAVRDTLESIRNTSSASHLRSKNHARTYTYDFPILQDVELDRVGGLELLVRCTQPTVVRSQTPAKRKDWWMQSKRLQTGALVCILDASGAILFCVVSDSTMRTADDKQARRPKPTAQESNNAAPPPQRQAFTLSDDAEGLFVRLQLVDPSAHEVGHALRWWQNIGHAPRRYLVEFPGVLLASFKDTLVALQEKYKKPDVPFSDLIAPTDPSANAEVGLPQYAQFPGFTFDLACVTRSNTGFKVQPRAPPTPEALSSQSTLDPTQSSALLNTLVRGLSLIQGPPGTGKSYTGEKIIKVLLATQQKSGLGPILCVCYTNHALDQLLEHLLDDNAKLQLIRMGSQSKSERLQNLNLRIVSQNSERTRPEKSGIWSAEETIREKVKEARDLLGQLSRSATWRTVRDHLATTFRRHHDELFPNEEDGWQKVNHQPERNIDQWLWGGDPAIPQCRPLEVLQSLPLTALTQAERRLLHRTWLRSIRDQLIGELIQCHREYMTACEQRDRLRRDVDLRCLNQAHIVGVTTTGLARNLDLMKRLRCKVMLCEEAGEVLEAHLLTALLPSVQHAILIGDHLQLKPQIANYDLQSTNPRGARFSLDTSLFERLVSPPDGAESGIPLSILETQRRMHPSIAELIRPTLYPSLKDDSRVSEYPEVTGMKRRLFWFHHEVPETGAADHDPLNTSHTNQFEVEMTVALVSHLVRQGTYTSSEIAVLTPYLGQLQRLRRRMESMFEICLNDRDLEDVEAMEASEANAPGRTTMHSTPTRNVGKTTLLKSIRIATVDNFQGEEATVVVVSLVRSNSQNSVGFLKANNRINVLLSRAKHGMYIIGNANTYSNVPMWKNVIGTLQGSGNFGMSLELQCPRHPDTPIVVSQPDHFVLFSPESGCSLPCKKRLSCGHACNGRCHSDILHDAIKCLEDCPRSKKGCNHACPHRCGDPCDPKCLVRLEDIDLALPCGHSVTSARCWEAQDPASIRCTMLVTRIVPGCAHAVTVPCHQDVTSPTYLCLANCGHHRPCGHTCASPCFHCKTREGDQIVREDHRVCGAKCGRKYTNCPHSCQLPCHEGSACSPCNAPCEAYCGHSRCSKPCHEPCSPCAEQTCQSRCAHTQCTMPCAAPCDWVPCSERCENLLDCGHRCPSLCGETCPGSAYCQTCASQDIKSTCVDFIEMKEYHEVNLDEEPCVFPACGHFITVSSLDGQMGMGEFFEMDDQGLPTRILGASVPFSGNDLGRNVVKSCPTCRGSLRNISRYGRIVRRGMLDEATKRFISWSTGVCSELAYELLAVEEKLQNTPAPKVMASSQSKDLSVGEFTSARLKNLYILQRIAGDNRRYEEMIQLWGKIRKFVRKVRQEEQPFQRVADFVQHANRRNGTDNVFRYEESIIQVKGHLLAMSLQLKTEAAVFSDLLGLGSGAKLPQQNDTKLQVDWSIYTKECAHLIELAKSTHNVRDHVQAHLFAAQFAMFARNLGVSNHDTGEPTGPESTTGPADTGDEASEKLHKVALDHIAQAREFMSMYKSTEVLKDELERVENMVRDGVFYQSVTTDEMKAVYKAMANEFSGTGHWYTCQNGHPFTVGECGMPMQLARCPECTAPVGGQNHSAVEGVRRAEDIDEFALEVGRLTI